MKLAQLPRLLLLLAAPIALCASSSSDRQIEIAATGSYTYRTVLENHVTVMVHDGVVTLSGYVEDNAERDLAFDTVENLPGVASVKNKLIVRPSYVEKSDRWIVLKLRTLLLMKAHVSGTNTAISAKDGVVTLGGTAENVAQKELTTLYAQDIDGVTSVKNEMVIKYVPHSETMGEKIDDASITSQVKFALLSHKATSALNTKVTTTDGVIAISGEANSETEKILVTKLAENVRGVKSVGNAMTVKS